MFSVHRHANFSTRNSIFNEIDKCLNVISATFVNLYNIFQATRSSHLLQESRLFISAGTHNDHIRMVSLIGRTHMSRLPLSPHPDIFVLFEYRPCNTTVLSDQAVIHDFTGDHLDRLGIVITQNKTFDVQLVCSMKRVHSK